jgi:hypothetical protein
VDEPATAETDTNANTDALSVYLAKDNSLRAETASRFQFQAQAYNFLVVVLAAAATAAAALLGSDYADRIGELILALPLVAGPLGYLYVSNDLMIFGIAGYLDRGLSPAIAEVLGRDVVLSDARLDALSRRGRVTLAALGYNRWLLFVVPTVGPIVYAALATHAWREFPMVLLFAADCLIALGLLAAIWVTAQEQIAWRHQHTRALAPAKRSATEPPARAGEDAGVV